MAQKDKTYVHVQSFAGLTFAQHITFPDVGGGSFLPMKAVFSADGKPRHTSEFVDVVIGGVRGKMQVSIWFPAVQDPPKAAKPQPTPPPVEPVAAAIPLPAALHPTPNVGQEYPPVHQDVQGGYPDNATLARMYPGIGAHNKGKTCMSVCCEGARKAQHRKALKDGTVPQVQTATVQAAAPTPAVAQAPTLTADQQQMADMMRMMQAMAAKLGM